MQNTSCDTKVKDRRAQLLTTQPIMTLPSTPTPAIQPMQCPKWRQNGVSNDDVLNGDTVLSLSLSIVVACCHDSPLMKACYKINWMVSAAL